MAMTEADKPKTKAVPERAAVTFEGLKKEFGDREGEAKYNAIARLEGPMKMPGTGATYTGRYFFDPAAEGPLYRPDLVIATLPADARRAAAEIIATPQVKE